MGKVNKILIASLVHIRSAYQVKWLIARISKSFIFVFFISILHLLVVLHWFLHQLQLLLAAIFICIIKDASIHGQANVFSAHHQLTHHVRLCVLTLCLLKGLNCISLWRLLYLLYHLSLNKLLLVHLNTSHSHLLLLHSHWHSVIMLVASNNYCILHILNNLLFLLLGLTCTWSIIDVCHDRPTACHLLLRSNPW